MSGPRVNRRGLLVGGGVLALGAVAGAGRGLLELLESDDELGTLERSSMARHLSETFTLVDADGATIELVSIEELPQASISNPEGQFAARFEAVRGLGLEQATHSMASRRFGEIELFISPIHDPNAEVDMYEALFNRPAEATS